MKKYLPILVLIALVIGLGGVYLAMQKQTAVVVHANPIPTSGYAISMKEVSPGNQVSIESVDLAQSAMVVVIKDVKAQTRVGQTPLLTPGHHSNLAIDLSSPVTDGDVIYIRLVDMDGKLVKNNEQLNIEVKKNVGMLMTHYASEY